MLNIGAAYLTRDGLVSYMQPHEERSRSKLIYLHSRNGRFTIQSLESYQDGPENAPLSFQAPPNLHGPILRLSTHSTVMNNEVGGHTFEAIGPHGPDCYSSQLTSCPPDHHGRIVLSCIMKS